MFQIRLGTVNLDLEKDTNFFSSFAANDIGKPSTRVDSFISTDFEIPATNINIALLNFPTSVNITSERVRRIAADIYQNNLLIYRGFIRVNRVNTKSKTISITFFGGNAGWITLVKDLLITELTYELEQYRHTGNDITTVVASWSNTSGYVYPLINYGKLNSRLNNNLAVTELYPATFVHTLITAIFSRIGYKVSGTLFSDGLFLKLILPFVNETFNTTNGVSLTSNLPAIKAIDLIKTVFAQFVVLSTTNEHTKTVYLNKFSDVKRKQANAVDWSSKVDLSRDAEIDYQELVQEYSKTNLLKYTAIEDFDSDDPIRLNFYPDSWTTDGNFTIGNDFLEEESDYFESVFSPTRNLGAGFYREIPFIQRFSYGKWTESDTKPRMLVYTGLIPTSDLFSSTYTNINLYQSAEFGGNLTGTVRIEKYNSLIYGTGTTFTTEIAYRDTLQIGTENIVQVSTAPASNTLAEHIGGNVTATFSEQTFKKYVFNGTPQPITQIGTAFFVKPLYGGSNNKLNTFTQCLGFSNPENSTDQTVIDSYYQELLDILNAPCAITEYLKITELDIHNLDFSTPIYLAKHQAYFYLNKIEDFDFTNSSQKVNLIKI